jgi:hypothetical protein
MEDLKDQIERLLLDTQNHEKRHFVPEKSLYRIMTEKSVRVALKRSAIKPYHVEELVKDIVSGARKVFAILTVIGCKEAIATMFGHDLLQTAPLDDKLPYSEELLNNIFSANSTRLTASKFAKEQWEFVTPTFSQRVLPRTLEDRMILPFLQERPLGGGSFGMTWEIEIHAENHRLSVDGGKVCLTHSGETPVFEIEN